MVAGPCSDGAFAGAGFEILIAFVIADLVRFARDTDLFARGFPVMGKGDMRVGEDIYFFTARIGVELKPIGGDVLD